MSCALSARLVKKNRITLACSILDDGSSALLAPYARSKLETRTMCELFFCTTCNRQNRTERHAYMARKQKFDYFEAFVKISEHAVQYSGELVKFMEKNAQIVTEGREPDNAHAIKRYEELHEIEEASDVLRHEIVDALSTEFLAPIEREDIMILSEELDSLVDDLDEVLQRMYMYDVHAINPDVIQMMKMADRATHAINELCAQFHNFKKPAALKPYIIKVNDVEREADQLYIRAVHDIYANAKVVGMTSIDAFGQAQMINTLEDVCDMCEDISTTVATVVMKNS